MDGSVHEGNVKRSMELKRGKVSKVMGDLDLEDDFDGLFGD